MPARRLRPRDGLALAAPLVLTMLTVPAGAADLRTAGQPAFGDMPVVTLPYAPQPAADRRRGGNNVFRLWAVVGDGGRRRNFQIDTGSTGVVTGRGNIGKTDTPERIDADRFRYASSGNDYSGQWLRATVSLGVDRQGRPASPQRADLGLCGGHLPLWQGPPPVTGSR